MNTPSHFLMTAAGRRALPGLTIPKSAVYLGSVAPDIPLYLLFVFGLFWFHTIKGMEMPAIWEHMWGYLYFNDPWWRGLHNLFHAPPVILTGLVVGRLLGRHRQFLGKWTTWFFAACALHCFVDILTHNDDGPLLLWPFNWDFRFSSPVSYWDPDHYGRQFAVFEITFDLVLSGYLIRAWYWEKRAASTESADAGSG